MKYKLFPGFQSELKSKGHPWELAKCFDTACPVSGFLPVSSIPDPHDVELVSTS